MDSLPIPNDRLAARPVRLSDAEMARKLSALEAYRTQFEALNQGPVGFLSNPKILKFELYWDVESEEPTISST